MQQGCEKCQEVYETVIYTGVVMGVITSVVCIGFTLLNIHVYYVPLGRVFMFGNIIMVYINNLEGSMVFNLPGIIMFLFMMNLPVFIMIGWMNWAIDEVKRVVDKYGCTERCLEEY